MARVPDPTARSARSLALVQRGSWWATLAAMAVLLATGCGDESSAVSSADAAGELTGPGSGDSSGDTAAPIPAAPAPALAASAPGGYPGGAATAGGPAPIPAPSAAPPSTDARAFPIAIGADGVGQPDPGQLTAGAWDDNLNYERFEAYRAEHAGLRGALQFTEEEHENAHNLFSGERPARVKLDVALVIDTTGSMDDELSYLQSEFQWISVTIEDRYPDAEQRWSLVLYRDTGDEYVVKTFDFLGDVDNFRKSLAVQSADGGGDYPEATDAAFEALNEFEWRPGDDVARLAFWVSDAPHHATRADRLRDALRGSLDLGIHIYPVASSGVDDLTELSMRQAAQLSGGRYLFLTDDSGIGAPHEEPEIPCYFVTRLDQAIARMINVELTGSYTPPEDADVIRLVGDPQPDRTCELQSGATAQAF